MKITYFKIENFRNIRLAECSAPPDFIVICGGNGCGKSALLQALMTAKEHAAPYGGFTTDPRAVSADADRARIQMRLSYADNERSWYKEKYHKECPAQDEIVIEIERGGRAHAPKRSEVTKTLLSWYSRTFANSPGFFDYIDAHRLLPKKQLSTWDASFLSDDRLKHTLSEQGQTKFQYTKEYLASLVMRDVQDMAKSYRDQNPTYCDSLKDIRDFFNRFFAPMEFVEVRIDTSPFQYIIRTPRGDIDIDDMSGGEKEVLNTFIRFHQLRPRDAVTLFDEADAHLHPDLERRYLEVLREFAVGNQLWLTTHSPEMMIGAGTGSLYTILKEPPVGGGNQFVRVSENHELHAALSEIMGSRGLVSFNQRIVFIEGDESSADREVYERLYPPGVHNVSFVPVGNSATVRMTAERVNVILSSSIGFQYYYSIVDGDISRAVPGPTTVNRLFQLPVYHVENLLLDDELILAVAKSMLGTACPYMSSSEIENKLKQIVLETPHIRAYAGALLDARVAEIANAARDSVFTRSSYSPPTVPTFDQVQQEALAIMQAALADGAWRRKCKGRVVLRAFCGNHSINYEHFRNSIIDRMRVPPPLLAQIMDRILAPESRNDPNADATQAPPLVPDGAALN